MVKFLNTSGTTYHLEELIREAKEKVILISPFLKLNDRIKNLIADKDRLKIDTRIVYGKSELHPAEINWLNKLDYVRTSFCKNLHAKCYINEKMCIITSMNLYEFSQQNNNEMGVLILRDEDNYLYQDAFEEAQHIIRMSEEVKISMEYVEKNEEPEEVNKMSSSKLAKKLKVSNTAELLEKMIQKGYLELKGGKHLLTSKGERLGGELKRNPKFGDYFIWPENIDI